MAQHIHRYNAQGDQQLLERIRNGEKEAFTELFQRHHVATYRYCLLMLGEKEAAEDIYQDIFFAMYKMCRDGKELRNIRGYLIAMARSRCLDYLQRRSRQAPLTEIEEPIWEPDLASSDTQDHLQQALLKIPNQYREAFVLHVLREYSYEEIADLLDVSQHVVKNRIYRAKQSLRKVLSPILLQDLMQD